MFWVFEIFSGTWMFFFRFWSLFSGLYLLPVDFVFFMGWHNTGLLVLVILNLVVFIVNLGFVLFLWIFSCFAVGFCILGVLRISGVLGISCVS